MHNGVNTFLRPKTFDVLTYLLKNAGRVISRKELLEVVWTDVIVTDDSLTQCLIEIRKALGDDQRKIVRTVPRRGYLFDLPVSVSAPAEIVHGEPVRRRWRQPSLWTLVAVAVLAVAIGSTWLRVGYLPRQLVSEQAGVHSLDEVADVLASKLLATDPYAASHLETTPGNRNMDAWNLYLRGKYFYGRRSPGDILRAQRYFEEALALDPRLAAAWVGLAGVLNLRWMQGGLPDDERLTADEVQPLMMYAVEKTLDLDPQNPEALMRLASLNMREGKFERAYNLIYQAKQYGRNSALVQSMLAGIAFWASDPDTAVKLQRRAVRLEPISFNQSNNLANYLYWAGQLDESAALYRQAYEINPGQQREGIEQLAWISIHQRNYANAEAMAELLPVGPARDAVWSMLRYQAGNVGESNAALDHLKQTSDIESQVRITYVYAFRGETDAAFHSLEAATGTLMSMPVESDAGYWFAELRSSRFLQSLHTDSRWVEWVTKTEKLLYDPLDVELAQSLKQYADAGLPE